MTRIRDGWTTSITSPTCRAHVDGLPSLGAYDVRLVLTTDWNPNVGVSAPKHRPVTLRDFLFVAMGDSLASGEGNPDVRGTYRWPAYIGDPPAEWKDEQCHRSALSGPALAAKAIEDASWKTSVTFVSLACSGAVVRNLYDTDQKGTGTQIGQLKRLLGAQPRRIHGMVISAGINDLDFSGHDQRLRDWNPRLRGHSGCLGQDSQALQEVR